MRRPAQFYLARTDLHDDPASSNAPWTWDDREHPDVMRVFAEPTGMPEWWDQLGAAATDAVVGKVLCVCAGAAIARAVLSAEGGGTTEPCHACEPLDLLDQWIDGPTEERFERICGLLLDENVAFPEPDPFGVVWWALRVATSTSYVPDEAAWALGAVCDGAKGAGLGDETLREIGRSALLARRHRPGARPGEHPPPDVGPA